MAGMPLFAHVGRKKNSAAPDLKSCFPLKSPRFGVSKTQKSPFFFALKRRAGCWIVRAFVRSSQSNQKSKTKSGILNQVSHVGQPA